MAKKGTRLLNPDGPGWCGPAAMTVLTGYPYKTCEAAIRKASDAMGDPWPEGIRGTYTRHVVGALRSMGLAVTKELWWQRGELRITVADFSSVLAEHSWWLLNIPQHWMALHCGRLWCSQTEYRGRPVRRHFYRNHRVELAYRVTGRANDRSVWSGEGARAAAAAWDEERKS